MIEKEITLLEALSGVDFVVEFLDGTKFRAQSEPGQVIKPDSLMTIEDKGLPFHKNPYKFGNLFVLFKVVFPDKLGENAVNDVKKTFAGMNKKKAEDASMDSETV